MRRLLLTASVAAVCAVSARPVDAQFTYGIQGAAMTGLEVPTSTTTVAELDATYGIGGRVMFSPPIPVLSLSLVGQGVYYFPENGDYMSYGIGARFGLGLPVITPYLIGGWQWRRTGDGTNTTTENGLTAGAGVELNFGVNVFLEGTVELGEDIPAGLPDYDNNALVIQAGVLFGG